MQKQTTSRKKPVAHKKSTKVSKINLKKRLLKYLPAAFLFLLAFTIHSPLLSSQPPGRGVLSYATSVSIGDLLNQTNSQRSGNGIASLGLNGQLNSAAQAKANDMVNKNYWAHVAPDGKQPWDFITAAGYSYTAAGENLAYGFETSADTVTGWMNSPPHRENLLNSIFTEVGFGIANSSNYVDSGPQTVVVAMYGHPQSLAAVAASAPTQTPAPQADQAPTAAVESAPPAGEPVAEPIQTSPVKQEDTNKSQFSVKSSEKNNRPLTASASSVSRIQILTGGNAAWSRSLLVMSVVGVSILWIIQRGFNVRKTLMSGEHFLLNHLHIDFTIFGFIALGWTLLQATGTVR